MESSEKFELIVRDLKEIIGEDQIQEILKTRDLKVYWGTAPTGKPHVGYYVGLLKIADLLKAGCHVKILFANIHAYLDNMKSSWELLKHRTIFYEFIIKEMLKIIDVPLEKLEFIEGTEFQLSEKYTLDMYRLSAMASTRDTKRAGAEVVKQLENPKMSSLIYPILQALDEEYLNVDIQLGGVDQRKIFMFAREFMPKIGYKKRIHLMTHLLPGLGESGKMSSSEPNSKIDFDDTDKQIKKKINKAFSIDGNIENNGLLEMLQKIIFKFLNYQKRDFVIDRPEQYGGKLTYKTYKEVESDFIKGNLASVDLKMGVANEMIKIVTPLREIINMNIELVKNAYPEAKKNK